MKGRERPCSIRRRLRSSQNVLQRSVELAAQPGHAAVVRRRLLLGVERTCRFSEPTSEFDPSRTFGLSDLRYLLVQERY